MKFFITWLLFILAYPAIGQKQGIGFHHYYGNIFRDSRQMVHLIKGFPKMYEFQWKNKRTGAKPWETVYNNPFTDLSFIFTDFANKEELGYSFSIIPQIQILFNENFFVTPAFTAGAGLSYHTKRFHPIENPSNVTIDSRINIVFHGYWGLQFRIRKNLLLDAGYGVTHFSNGNLKEPNTGLNLILLNTGLNFLFIDKNQNNFSDTTVKTVRTNFWSIALNQSFKQLPSAGYQFFYALGGSCNFNFPFTKMGYFILGLDFFMDYAVKYIIMNESEITYKSPLQFIRSGITAGYIFKFEKLEIVTQFGYYIYLPFKNVTSTYQRVGVQYVFSKNITAGIFLKTHYGHADYLEWTVGWRF